MTDDMRTNTPSPTGSFREWIVDRLPLALAITALPISIIALIWAINAGETTVFETGSLSGPEAAQIAENALAQAQENNSNIGTVLSLLEVGLALLGGIVAVGAVIFTVNLRDIRGDLERRAEANENRVLDRLESSEQQVERRLTHREQELSNLSEQLRTVVETTKTEISDMASNTEGQIDRLTRLIGTELNSARQKAENSFKVLSLQLLAEQQVRARNYRTAIQTLEEAYQLDDQNQTTNYLLGYLYITRGQYEEARDFLNKALDVNPEFAPALAALGLVESRLGNKQKDDIDTRNTLWALAEVKLLKALQMDQNMVDADGESYYGTLGGLYRRQGRTEDAIHAYRQAVNVTPQSSYPAGNLAVLYKITGQDEKADEMFARVQEIAETILDDNPSDNWTRLDLGQSLLAQGKTEEAMKAYRNLIFREPSTATLDIGAGGLEYLRQSPTPIPGLDEAIKLLRETVAGRNQEEIE